MRKVFVFALLGIAACIAGCNAALKKPANDDDRPPIIVTNGSINFDGGDPNDSTTHPWKDWAKANGSNNKKQWTQDNPNGFSVSSFDVTIAGSTTTSCNRTTQMVSAVSIEYIQDSGATSLIAVQRSQWSNGGNKLEPWITATVDMSTMPRTSGKPDRLSYDPGGSSDKGHISYVVLFSSSAPVSCAFSKPPAPPAPDPVSVTIQPVR